MGLLPDATGFYPTLWIALAVILISWFMLYKTPFGLRLRACGEHPNAAASVGVNIFGMRYFAVLASGFLAGLSGACMVLTQSIQYTSNTVNGTGFIALAAVAFGRWKPLGIVGSTFLFGLASALAVLAHDFFPRLLQHLPAEVFNIVPYAITLLALVIFSGKNYAPAADQLDGVVDGQPRADPMTDPTRTGPDQDTQDTEQEPDDEPDPEQEEVNNNVNEQQDTGDDQ